MAALRSLILLGFFVAFVNASGEDLRNFIEIVNGTYTSVVIMEACPIGAQILLPCCVLLGVASAGMVFHKKPSEKGQAACGCCCASFLFFILFFAPVFALLISRDPTCVDAKPHANSLENGTAFVAVMVAWVLVSAAVVGWMGKEVQGLGGFVHDKAQLCCSCCGKPNDNGMANMVVFLLGFALLALFAGVFMFVWDKFAVDDQIRVCLVEIVTFVIFYFFGGFGVFSKVGQSIYQSLKEADSESASESESLSES